MKTPILTALLIIVNILPAASTTTASFTPQFAQAENTISQPSQNRDSIALFDDDDDDEKDELTPAQIRFNQGVEKYNSGDKREAILYFNKAIELDRKYAAAYKNRGIAKYNLGDKRGGIIDVNKAISINPNYAEAYSLRGEMKSTLGDKRGAIMDYSKAISLDSKNASWYNSRGILKLKGDKRGALLDFDRAIAIDPNYADAYKNRGIATSLLNNNRSGLVDLQRAAEMYRQQGKTESYQQMMALIQKLSR